MPMSRKIAEELLPRMRQRYMGRGREGRSLLSDKLREQWGYRRKHALKRLGAKNGWGGDPAARKERPPKYAGEVEDVLWRIWRVSEQPCGKRLKALLPQCLPHYEDEYGRLGRDIRSQELFFPVHKLALMRRKAMGGFAATVPKSACLKTGLVSHSWWKGQGMRWIPFFGQRSAKLSEGAGDLG